MKVLIISQHYWPESFRINEVVESLQLSGCEVSVLTGQPNYPEGKVFPKYRWWACRHQLHSSGYSIYRVPLIPRGPSGAFHLIANYLSFVLCASGLGPWLLRGKQFDVVFVYAPSPIFQAIVGMVMKLRFRAVLVTWVQDLWPQSLVATGFVHNRTILGLVEKAVRWVYRHNELLLVPSEAFIPSVQAMAGSTHVRYHPNPSETFAQVISQAVPAITLGEGFTVVFAGNLGKVQALETILEAAEILRSESGVRFILIGSGSRDAWVRSEVKRRYLHHVEMPGRFAPQEMPAILAQASALLVSLVRDPIMSLTIPSKVQTYLAAGRPIIAALDGEGARVVLAAGAGVACPAEDAVALAQAILSLRHSSPQVLEKMGAAGRDYHACHFSSTLLTERLIGHFRDVVARRSRWAAVN